MKEMGKVAVMTEAEVMEYREYEVPNADTGGVVVKVLRTNICGSELHIWKGMHPTKKSGVLGHEMVGEVYSLGEGVDRDYAGESIKIGDRVVAAYYITCRKCTPCQEGNFHLCEHAYDFWNLDPNVAPHFHGTFATHYYIHPDQYFYKVPDSVSDVAAASANCALSQVYFGIDKAQITYGQSVVIQGAGGLGLNAAAVAKEKGATVIIIDGVQSRLELAKKFGADHVINLNEFSTLEARTEEVLRLTDGKGAHAGIEVSGVPAAFAEGIHLIRQGGKYVSIGNISPGKLTPFDPGLLTRKSIQVLPVVRYDPWYLKKALDFLKSTSEKYPFNEMLDREFSLAEIKTALDESAARNVVRGSIVIAGKSALLNESVTN